MEPVSVVHPFKPLMSEHSRILILGSFPSVKSREQAFYYGHPQNRFWPVIASVYGEQIPHTIDEKTQLILRHDLALWDSIASCTIIGSSDSSVKDAVPNDLSGLLAAAPIKRIICNGKLSGSLYHRYLETKTGMTATVLPSTSPANASWSLDRLIDAWSEALNF